MAAPSSAVSCRGGRLNSCTTVTVQAVAHSMTVGSATWHGPENCLLADACLSDPLKGAGTCAEAVRDGDYCAMHEREQQATDEAAKDGDHRDALGE